MIAEFWEEGKIVAAICQGVAALIDVKLADGSYLLQGKRMTGPSELDDEQLGMVAMPLNLEQRLRERGGVIYEKAAQGCDSRVVIDGQLITGQNAASASEFGRAILAAL